MTRPRTYYLPWITRPGLECALVLSNVEARFKPEFSVGPFPVSVVQYDALGSVAHRYAVTLKDSTDTVEVPLRPAAGDCGQPDRAATVLMQAASRPVSNAGPPCPE